MEMLHVRDNGDVVSGLMALRKLLSIELVNVEKLTEEVNAFMMVDPLNESDISIEECQQARTGLLSALASIDELFGWVHLLAVCVLLVVVMEYVLPLSLMSFVLFFLCC